MMSVIFCGCAKEEKSVEIMSSEMQEEAYLANLEDGNFYIRHKNKICDPVYFGNGTFDAGATVSNPDSARIMWYKDDFNTIPTLYEGDSLIFYTNNVLNESFIFERFEDLGYSVGICRMAETLSGRFSISTLVEDRCTYPNGDTDELLNLTNELVILDTLGGNYLRVVDEEAGEESYLSRCGTVNGLEQNKKYAAEIYEGTVRHEYIFTADVRILGSMEVTESTDYMFESKKIINIAIPEFFNTGYYMINGIGMFRYVNGPSYDKNTDFNVVNNIPDEEGTNTHTVQLEDIANIENSDMQSLDETMNTENAEIDNENMENKKETTSSFEVKNKGTITVNANFTIEANNSEQGDGLPDVTAIITSPSGKSRQMIEAEDGLTLTFMADEIGIYTVLYYDLDIRTPHIEVIMEQEEDKNEQQEDKLKGI